MKIISILEEIVELFKICNVKEPAKWIEQKLFFLKTCRPNSPDFKKALKELDKNMAGMGSFSDISLNPPADSAMTRDEAQKKQWDLVERFGVELENMGIE